ncbi:MAG TPA: nucleotidyltransferase domain-containing protein [Solirubrobacteraceae bacterium]|nr:nucleotidyltransferase domain-containing protein [Solirubrobacteraceae bacterium]
MDIAHPYAAICPTLDSGILTMLARTTRPLTGREVARLLDRPSHGGVLGALNRLCEQGVVDRQEAGRALLYTLNREHLATPAVEILAGLRAELLDRLRAAIVSFPIAPDHVSLFGSFARGEGDAHSDIDLFIVRPAGISDDEPQWRAQLDGLARQLWRWTGNRAGIAEVTATEIKRLRRRPPPIVAELRSDAITLCGPEIMALFGKA